MSRASSTSMIFPLNDCPLNIFQNLPRRRSIPKTSHRKHSVSRGANEPSTARSSRHTTAGDSSKTIAAPLKRGAKITDRLHPLLSETQVLNSKPVYSPSISEKDVTSRLTSRTAAIAIKGDCEETATTTTSKIDRQKSHESSSEQNKFLPPIK